MSVRQSFDPCSWSRPNPLDCWKIIRQNPRCFRERENQRCFLSSVLLLAWLFLLSMASSTSSNQLNSGTPYASYALHLFFTPLPSSSQFCVIFLVSSYPISRACHVQVQTVMSAQIPCSHLSYLPVLILLWKGISLFLDLKVDPLCPGAKMTCVLGWKIQIVERW